MQYKTETHMHTSEGSDCAIFSAAEMVRFYAQKGYSTIFVTDHFFNGNTAVPNHFPWRERVNRYTLGWKNACIEAEKYNITAIFGVELTYKGMDFLVYNLPPKWFADHPEIMRMETIESLELIRECGGFVVQAHPFREAPYIRKIVTYPKHVDAFEVHNPRNPEKRMNDAAFDMAKEYGLIMTAGSDAHSGDDIESGILTDKKICSAADYIEALQSGNFSLIISEY